MKKKWKVFCCFLIWFYSQNALSKATYQFPQSRFYSTQHGLSQASIYDIEEDSNGYLWFATQLGINRFDGYEFVSFGQKTKGGNGLSGSYVFDLEIDPVKGDLYVGNINGLDLLEQQSGQFKHVYLDTASSENEQYIVRKIKFDAQNNLWVGSNKGLFYRPVGSNEFTKITHEQVSYNVYDLDFDKKGNVWVTTKSGLLMVDSANFHKLPTVLLANKNANTVFIDSDQALWVGTNGYGLFKYSLKELSPLLIANISTNDGLVDPIVNDIKQMSDGSIWVATANGASILFDPENLSSLDVFKSNENTHIDNGVNHNNIKNFFQSKSGVIFFGTIDSGFGVIDPNKTLIKSVEFDNSDSIYFVTAGKNGEIWASGTSGVWKVNSDLTIDGPFQYGNNDGKNLAQNKLTAVYFSHLDDTLWVASKLGLSKLNEHTQQLETVPFKSVPIYTITEDELGMLWIGSYDNGLFYYDPNTNEVIFTVDTPLVSEILSLNKSQTWVTTLGGLYLVDSVTKSFKHFSHDPNDPASLPHNVITWISEISPGNYFLGTQGKGLWHMRYDESMKAPIFKQLFTDSPIAKSSIGGVIKGADNSYWVASSQGLSRLNESFTLIDNYSQSEGVSKGGYYIARPAENEAGLLFFAGVKSFNYFDPLTINTATDFPPLELTKIKTLSLESEDDVYDAKKSPLKELPNDYQLVLEPNNLMVTVEFTSLEYGSPESIQYAYKLKGFDNRWQYIDSINRSALFTNLSPGHYELEIKNTNRHGIWTSTPKVLNILVKTPWWQTIEFILLSVILFFVFTYLFYRWRTYSLHQQAIALNSLVDSKTKDLKHANELLKLLTEKDSLTQLMNRRGFTERANHELKKYQRDKHVFCICLFDVDEFKNINDTFGHSIGDHVLIEIANVIKSSVRKTDVAARWGGEEFIVLIPNVDLSEANRIAEKIRLSVSSLELEVKGITLSPTISGGIASIEKFNSLDECINCADDLLYKAKDLGRNRVCL